MIYLDHAATSIPSSTVLDVYHQVVKSIWYNPSSMHKLGIIAKNYIDKATTTILKTLGLQEKNIYYTSGATEANNLAIYGICMPYMGKNKHIITTQVEHPSVYRVFQDLEKKGFRVTYLSTRNGVVDIEELKSALTKDTILVSMMWVNNIIGSIQPIHQMIQVVKAYSHSKIHVDAVQGIGKIPFDYNPNEVDLMTITMHKIGGLKGTGLLITSKSLALQTMIHGGHQQNDVRGGTMDVAGIVAASKTLTLAYQDLDVHYQYVQKLNDYLLQHLKDIPFVTINQSRGKYSPYVVSISFSHIKGETVMHYLEQYDIYVGIGSACNEKQQTLERAIQVLTDETWRAINMIRISLSEQNTTQDIDELIVRLKALERM
ncbi:MAG: cysteine desulfurase [Anaeroplasma bactoclasticum]|nr:cysteine desulfurase [Anaeroplasma bactoclasticum]